MNCTPQSLLQAASCYRCIPKPVMRSTMISLLCEWANNLTPPCVVDWSPPNQTVTWNDAAGNHFGDLAAFTATADFSSVVSMEFSGLGLLSDISGIECLPILNTLRLTSQALTSLDVHGATSLGLLECFDNAITSLNVSGCSSLAFLDCNTNQLGTIDLTGDFAITFLDVSSNPAVVIIGP